MGVNCKVGVVAWLLGAVFGAWVVHAWRDVATLTHLSGEGGVGGRELLDEFNTLIGPLKDTLDKHIVGHVVRLGALVEGRCPGQDCANDVLTVFYGSPATRAHTCTCA